MTYSLVDFMLDDHNQGALMSTKSAPAWGLTDEDEGRRPTQTAYDLEKRLMIRVLMIAVLMIVSL